MLISCGAAESWWFRSILVAVMVATVASVVVNQQYASNSVGIVSPSTPPKLRFVLGRLCPFFPRRVSHLWCLFHSAESTEKAVKSSESLLSEDESSVAASAEENTSDLSHTANAGIGSSARVTSNEEGLTTIKIDEDFDQWTEEKQQDFLKVCGSLALSLSFRCISLGNTVFGVASLIDSGKEGRGGGSCSPRFRDSRCQS